MTTNRLIAVARGGTASWYHGICGIYEDVFDYFSPDECYGRAVNHADVHHKQEEVGELDRDIMARVQRALCGIDSVGVYSRPRRMQPHHLDVARRVFSTLNGGAFVPLDTSHIELLQDVFSHPEAARIM